MLAGFSKSFGLDEETALRVACGFGGGVGRLGLTCGAVTGAVMVIGLKYGKVKADDDAAKEKHTRSFRNSRGDLARGINR